VFSFPLEGPLEDSVTAIALCLLEFSDLDDFELLDDLE
jgi:hypothetical protein